MAYRSANMQQRQSGNVSGALKGALDEMRAQKKAIKTAGIQTAAADRKALHDKFPSTIPGAPEGAGGVPADMDAASYTDPGTNIRYEAPDKVTESSLMKMYMDYKKAVDKENSLYSVLPSYKAIEVGSFKDWLKGNFPEHANIGSKGTTSDDLDGIAKIVDAYGVPADKVKHTMKVHKITAAQLFERLANK